MTCNCSQFKYKNNMTENKHLTLVFLRKYQGAGQKNAISWPQNAPVWEKQGKNLIIALYSLIHSNFLHMTQSKTSAEVQKLSLVYTAAHRLL